MLDLLNDGVPCWIGEIEDEILRSVVYRPSENFGPRFEVRPCLFWAGTREWRETLVVSSARHIERWDGTYTEEFEEDTPKRPIVGRESISLSSQDLWRHTVYQLLRLKALEQLTSQAILQQSRPICQLLDEKSMRCAHNAVQPFAYSCT